MVAGSAHAAEYDKKMLARLFEAYLELLGIEAEGYGSWTGGASADQCYVLSPIADRDALDHPELVLEVVSPSGGLDKLDEWWRLGVQEVWFWDRADRLQIFVRGADGFDRADRSVLVAGVDPALISTCMDEPTQPAAVKALRVGAR